MNARGSPKSTKHFPFLQGPARAKENLSGSFRSFSHGDVRIQKNTIAPNKTLKNPQESLYHHHLSHVQFVILIARHSGQLMRFLRFSCLLVPMPLSRTRGNPYNLTGRNLHNLTRENLHCLENLESHFKT